MTDFSTDKSRPIAVVGAGTIGLAWSIVFAQAGLPVRLFDVDPDRLAETMKTIGIRLAELDEYGLIDETPAAIAARIVPAADLAGALGDARHVQENVPENLDLKRRVLAEIAEIAPVDCVIVSSTSFIPGSRLGADLPGRERFLVVHPGNPPYLLRIAEIVPAPFTSEDATACATALMRACDMAPVLVRKEVEGFVFNRLQGAVLREAYCLVRDGVASVEDIDALMRDGLGFRWALLGPFESVDLNQRGGVEGHATRMGPAYARMGAERGQNDPWTPDLVASVTAQRRALLPLDKWGERGAWRDRALMALLKAKRSIGQE